MSSKLLELKAIRQEFQGYRGNTQCILNDIDLSVSGSEFVALIGPSGCGKTTLLNIIGGFSRPAAGQILIDGKPAGRPSRDRGIVYQDYMLFPWMTVLENIIYGFELEEINFLEKYYNPLKFKKVRREACEKAEFYLKETGLSHAAGKYPHQLSGGMKQRVAISQAMVMKPKILLMDEPFGALDVHTRESLQLLMLKIKESVNNTIIFVTHDIEEAIYLADRIIVLSQHQNGPGNEHLGSRLVHDERLGEEFIFRSDQPKDISGFQPLIRKLMSHGFAYCS